MPSRRLKVVLPGGTGQVGAMLVRGLRALGHEVVVLGRSVEPGRGPLGERRGCWNAQSRGTWWEEIDGADVVVNLAGRTVNCRYSETNLRQMRDSRVHSTRAVGEAIASAASPPSVWLQMSTATIYSHRFDAANDEIDGILGGSEPGVPAYWARSVEIARAWEAAQNEVALPQTRLVALRTALVLSPDPGGVFAVLRRLTRLGLGGAIAGGGQFVSWIHELDFVAAVLFLIGQPSLSGAFNLAAPEPLPQRDFQRTLRRQMAMPVGLPATRWMAAVGAFVLRTDPELVLKSRRVVPRRLIEAGFRFRYPTLAGAVEELLTRSR